jgi:hypothetical protein
VGCPRSTGTLLHSSEESKFCRYNRHTSDIYNGDCRKDMAAIRRNLPSAVPASSYLHVCQTSTTLKITTPNRRPHVIQNVLFLLWLGYGAVTVANTSYPSLAWPILTIWPWVMITLSGIFMLVLPFFERSIFQVQPEKWITHQRQIQMGLVLKSRSSSGSTKDLLGAKVRSQEALCNASGPTQCRVTFHIA